MVKNVCGQSGHGTLKLTNSKMNRWNKLIFRLVVQVQGSKKLIQLFLGELVRNGHGRLVHETLKSAVSSE